jgi:hypothetical protein
VGWAVLALALIPPRAREARDPARLVALAVWIGLAATLLHRYRDPRFLFTVAPLVWLAAARNAVAAVNGLIARLPRGREAAWATLGAGLVAGALAAAPPAARVREQRAAWSTPADLTPALDRVIDAAAPFGRSWLLGYANPLSPSLLAWRAHLVRPARPEAKVPGRPTWLPPDATEHAIAERVAMLRASGLPVIAALPTPALAARMPAYAEEVRGDSATAAGLAGDAAVMVVSDETLEPAGMRVRVFQSSKSPHSGDADYFLGRKNVR